MSEDSIDYNINVPKENLEYLINLSKYTNINIFKKKKNKWILREKRVIVDECNKMKKKKIKNLSSNLKDKSNQIIKVDEIKEINNKTITEIDNIDSLINILSKEEDNIDDIEFIEVYSNY